MGFFKKNKAMPSMKKIEMPPVIDYKEFFMLEETEKLLEEEVKESLKKRQEKRKRMNDILREALDKYCSLKEEGLEETNKISEIGDKYCKMKEEGTLPENGYVLFLLEEGK